ncbi:MULTISPECIES: NADH-quinone oxidoreductase subunit NuoH [Acidobacterium]|uniref:NADH-quinone oxidoreductase subunit H n=1 Tax=Acidobacterium capsulatum (strain ATCC 51196 / DSM 11244 / BCRC 80197 / JCM 7670 / NBRC 15755 / NCIMB 13165 / 161) TaxID=240015 RepID=C1F217_ACIC5|nr:MULTISPECIES: NADH-quinone oxidoreductase subunit NuoH [Acidobacterium]ACO34024.1 NADH dehydrogenase I, H subunit [Acidobacterium capsulatum ATCC 51196]
MMTLVSAQSVDQVFVNLDHWLVAHTPAPLQPLAAILLIIVPILAIFPGLFALTTVLERKGLGRMQNRFGPNRVGPLGLLQPVADGIKALTKEDIVPRSADALLHFLAPVVIVCTAFLAYAVLPIGRNMIAVHLDAGILFFFAIGSATELAVFMAGWSSRNKYSLLGAMRAIAQMISYEIPLILSSVAVIMIAGTLSPEQIVTAQAGFTGIFPHWYVFTPWGFAGFFLFMTAAAAETNRSPFDLPEGESEIIAGYFIEYSGFKFALFFLAEYLEIFAVSGLGITLFLGGWSAPFSFLTWIPSWCWFFAKLLVLIATFIWIRGTLPRLRMDQLMNFAWKFMLPMTLLEILSAGIWRFFPQSGFWPVVRWLACALLLAVPYILLARGLEHGRRIEKRVYRYAEES